MSDHPSIEFPYKNYRPPGRRRSRPLWPKVIAKIANYGEPGVCWEWTAQRDMAGYGVISAGGTRHKAHRLVFRLMNGYWPVECRHSCDNPPCVNPAHLLDGTHAENMADMVDRGRHNQGNWTHCSNGHEFTQENTYRFPGGPRMCRTCRTLASADRYYEQRPEPMTRVLSRRMHPCPFCDREYSLGPGMAMHVKGSHSGQFVKGTDWSAVAADRGAA